MNDMRYNQSDYNVALCVGLLAGACVGGALGFTLCAIVVRVLGI
jgi:hypothetical protein